MNKTEVIEIDVIHPSSRYRQWRHSLYVGISRRVYMCVYI